MGWGGQVSGTGHGKHAQFLQNKAVPKAYALGEAVFLLSLCFHICKMGDEPASQGCREGYLACYRCLVHAGFLSSFTKGLLCAHTWQDPAPKEAGERALSSGN